MSCACIDFTWVQRAKPLVTIPTTTNDRWETLVCVKTVSFNPSVDVWMYGYSQHRIAGVSSVLRWCPPCLATADQTRDFPSHFPS